MSWVLHIPSQHAAGLAQIRHWPELKYAPGDNVVWVRGFTNEQLEEPCLRSIPYITLYREQNGQLIPEGAKLPIAKLPALLWTPIARALPVEAPDYNHNLFEVSGQITVRLVPHASPQPVTALRTTYDQLHAFVKTSAAARLQGLAWVLTPAGEVLILGNPLPPLPGTTYWAIGNHLLPAGYHFEFPELAIHIERASEDWWLWDNQGTCASLLKTDFRPLSRSSVALSQRSTSTPN